MSFLRRVFHQHGDAFARCRQPGWILGLGYRSKVRRSSPFGPGGVEGREVGNLRRKLWEGMR